MIIPIISLFSGSGGLDLGFEQEGFCPIIAYDNKPSAIETYNYNRENKVARQKDLSHCTTEEIIEDISVVQPGFSPKGVIGGPPCQYFSRGNTTVRNGNDPKRVLPIKYANILKGLNSIYELDFFLFENVQGLVDPTFKDDFEKICLLFDDAGFHVFWEVLDAFEFGVPQHRKRVFLIGWNKTLYGTKKYEFPIGTSCRQTVKDAIDGLAEPCFYTRDCNPERFPEHPNHWTMRPVSAKFRNPSPPGLRRDTRSFRRLAWDQPSYTVAYGHNEIHVHPNGHRRLSVYEAMLLQGFPKDRTEYRLIGNLTEQVNLVSDAVPPPLSALLAQSVREFMEI